MKDLSPSPRTVFGLVLLAASVITVPAVSAFSKHTIDATTLIIRFGIAIAVCGIAARILLAFVRSMSAHPRTLQSDDATSPAGPLTAASAPEVAKDAAESGS